VQQLNLDLKIPAYPDYVVFCSYGNDSIAMLQLLAEYRLQETKKVCILYSDTGWADASWEDRVTAGEAWATSKGFHCFRTEAMGMPNLVRQKKVFPRGLMQFCTSELKIFPAQRWLAENDPKKVAVCVNGVRRAESQRRANTPVFLPISDAHGGRPLWSAMAEFSDEDRDAMIAKTGFELLPHRSKECSPCIFANRKDLRLVPPERVDEIRALEAELAPGRTMFKPKAKGGAIGIDEVMRWARSEHGKYSPLDNDVEDCDSGFCGS
jgi:3'-phosphoadenosine 5'-phosphosulfate sulfotransferase (PAPS reductase)/FAD synthetase